MAATKSNANRRELTSLQLSPGTGDLVNARLRSQTPHRPRCCRNRCASRSSTSAQYPLIENEYKNGESQRSVQAATSRKKWSVTKRLTPSQLAALRTFYDARNGTHEPFYFYDPYDTNPKFSYDPTGAAVDRQVHRPVQHATGASRSTPGRSDVQIELIELA